jgi:hypothetical protein
MLDIAIQMKRPVTHNAQRAQVKELNYREDTAASFTGAAIGAAKNPRTLFKNESIAFSFCSSVGRARVVLTFGRQTRLFLPGKYATRLFKVRSVLPG